MTRDIVRRLYIYVAAYLGLQLLLAGARSILNVIISGLVDRSPVGGAGQFAATVSLSVALIIVGLPLWAGHWLWAQRMIRAADEQQSALRRLYCYVVLLSAMLGMLFDLQTLVGLVLAPQTDTLALPLLGTLLLYGTVWLYHWNVLRADRLEVEQKGWSATLRRWYLFIVQGFSLGMASFGAVQLVHLLLQKLFVGGIGSDTGVGHAVGSLIAGFGIWLPHHVWGQRLVLRDTQLRADEAASTLRQVYAALSITIGAVAALGGLTTVVYGVLLAAFGGSTWRSVVVDNTEALAIAPIAGVVWWYHRAQLLKDAHAALATRIETAQRIVGYLTAAIGLGALFFGLGGLIGTLLRLLLAPSIIGTGWRDGLSLGIALSMVALPVYALAAREMERKARTSSEEEHALARRIYLYAVLLFGIGATITAIVTLIRIGLSAVLGDATQGWTSEFGGWLGYALLGGAIAMLYTLLVRRSSRVRNDAGAYHVIAIVAHEPLRTVLVTVLTKELPGATLRTVREDDSAGIMDAITGADTLIIPLAVAFNGAMVQAFHAFSGQRLLLATDAPGYRVIGMQGDEELALSAARLLLRKTPTVTDVSTGSPLVGSVS
ncbi:MAG: DUF5671 domain-containing protein [Herpetosiphon sp.]